MLLVHMHTDNDKENRGFLAKHKGIKLLNYVNRNLERRSADIYQIPEFLIVVQRGCLILFAEKAKYRKPSGMVLTKTTRLLALAFWHSMSIRKTRQLSI